MQLAFFAQCKVNIKELCNVTDHLLINVQQWARVDSALFFTFRFGLFAFGYYGIGFELSVEATYPIDEGKFGYQLSRAIAIRR